MIGIRLQGGPYDGAAVETLKRPPFLWATTRGSRTVLSIGAVSRAVVYRRDTTVDGWLIYVFTDPDAERHLSVIEAVMGGAR